MQVISTAQRVPGMITMAAHMAGDRMTMMNRTKQAVAVIQIGTPRARTIGGRLG